MSLIEMLVVIAIIGVLVALSTAVVTVAMSFASNLQNEVAAAKNKMKHSRTNVVRPSRTKDVFIPDQYMIVLADNADPTVVAARLRQSMPLQVLNTFTTSFKGLSVSVPSSYLPNIMQDPAVRFVEQDQYMGVAQIPQTLPDGVKRIGGFNGLNATINTTQSGDGIGKPISLIVKQTLDQPGTLDGINVNLVIVDTGVALHNDLFVIEDKSQQLTQAVLGVSGATNFVDTHGHGTLMAGIAAARDDGFYVVGVAPGAKIWACKAIAPAVGTQTNDQEPAAALSIVTKAVEEITKLYITANTESDKPHVVYIGFTTSNVVGTTSTGLSLNAAITALVNAGSVVVVPAGNGAVDASTVAPANCARAITVGAMVDLNGSPSAVGFLNAPAGVIPAMQSASSFRPTTLGAFPYADETLAPFSNFNSGANTAVDILAPGVDILSTINGGAASNRTYCTGTSAAAAHVAGLAVLSLDANARISQNIVNGRSIFNSLGFGIQTPTPNIPDSVDYLMKNLYDVPTLPSLFSTTPYTPLSNSTISGIRVANTRLF